MVENMAIDDVATSFRVTARAPDGVVEAIESAIEDWTAIGVQFHPESVLTEHGAALVAGFLGLR